MKTVRVNLNQLYTSELDLGFVGENEHRQIVIDCAEVFAEYPHAVPALTVQPPMGMAYPATAGRDGDNVVWTITDSDLIKSGRGEMQLTFTENGVMVKSCIGRISINRSIEPSGDVPEPIENWLVEANTALNAIPQTIDDALQEAKDSGEFDGFSPTATVSKSGDTATISITDKEGTTTATVKDGAKGDPGTPGQDGFSPIATVTKSDDTATISITDKNGTTTAIVKDGKDGTDGQDGYSPTATVTKSGDTATISITDKNGTTTATVTDGQDGVNGATPVISIGTVSTLSPGSSATASMDTTDPAHPVLSMGIPEGEPGEVTEAELSAVAESKADIIHDTASGAIASFPDGADGLPVKTLTVGIEPVQDLHGQSNPYPAGGGVNRFDGVWESGAFNGITGEEVAYPAFSRSVNFIAVLPNTDYYVYGSEITSTTEAFIFAYQDDETYISYTKLESNGTYTTPSNCAKVRLEVRRTIETVTNYLYAFNYPNTVTTYAPYSNICPISGWTGANVTRTGVNVWDEDWEVGGIDSYGQNSSSTAYIRSKGYIEVKSETNYFVKSSAGLWMWGYDNNKNYIGRIPNDQRVINTTIMIPSNCSYIRFVDPSGNVYKNDISINYPATDTQYHAYSGSTAEYEFPQAAKPVYGGTLTVNKDGTGTLVVDRAKLVIDGTGTFGDYESTTEYAHIPMPVSSQSRKNQGAIQCDILPQNGTKPYSNTGIGVWQGGSAVWYICVKKALLAADNKESFVAWLASNQPNCVYYLTDPVTYNMTNLEVIETLKGVNNVWSDTGDSAVTYPADTKLYIDKKFTELQALILEQ